MKYLVILLFIGILAPSCLGNYRRSPPLCFPNGWPRNCPPPQCYQPGWQGSWNNPNVACVAPIINGCKIRPCWGAYI